MADDVRQTKGSQGEKLDINIVLSRQVYSSKSSGTPEYRFLTPHSTSVLLVTGTFSLFNRYRSNLNKERIRPHRFIISFDSLGVPTEYVKASAHFILCPCKAGGNKYYTGKYF